MAKSTIITFLESRCDDRDLHINESQIYNNRVTISKFSTKHCEICSNKRGKRLLSVNFLG